MANERGSRRPRRRFDDEFKAQVVRLVLDEGKTVGAVARELDLTETALRDWVKRAQADRTNGRTGVTTAEREELARPPERESDSAGRAGDPKKGGSLLRERAAVKFRFIATEKAHHSLSLLCRCLRVTRSGFYAWQRRPESAQAKRDRQLKVLVHASFAGSKGRYGSPRIQRDLLEEHQERVSRKRVMRLMQEEQLKPGPGNASSARP